MDAGFYKKSPDSIYTISWRLDFFLFFPETQIHFGFYSYQLSSFLALFIFNALNLKTKMFQPEQESAPIFAQSLSPLNTEQEIMWGVWPSEEAQEETCGLATVSLISFFYEFCFSLALREFAVPPAAPLGLIQTQPLLIPNGSVFLSGPTPPPLPLLVPHSSFIPPCAVPSSTTKACGALVSTTDCSLSEESLTLPRMMAPDLVPTQSPYSILYSIESPQTHSTLCQSQSSFYLPAQSSGAKELESFCEILNADNYDEFRQDVFTDYNAPIVSDSIPFLDKIITSVRSEIQQEQIVSSPSSMSNSSQSPSAIPTLTLSTEQSVEFIGEDGKKYKVVLQPVEETTPKKALKRKISSPDIVKSKRTPGISLVDMSEEEISERKKEQNRAAAQRYREKMKINKQAEVEERKTLANRNAYLRVEADRLEKEITQLRSFIFNRVSS